MATSRSGVEFTPPLLRLTERIIMSECYGPYRDTDDGALYCVQDYRNAPDCGESWEDFCTKCNYYRAWYNELKANAGRDDE
jgi:hypothetical protein